MEKKKRIVNKDAMRQAIQRDGMCLWGMVKRDGCSDGLDPHHIKTRGSGGNDELPNLITLCRKHHNEAHSGKITKDELYAVLARFYGYEYE